MGWARPLLEPGWLVHRVPSTVSPFPERCRHVTVGSGLPKARHMRVTLLPSFTVMSDEMLTIWGGTARHKEEQRHHQYISSPGPNSTPPACRREALAVRPAPAPGISICPSARFGHLPHVSKPASQTGAEHGPGVCSPVPCAGRGPETPITGSHYSPRQGLYFSIFIKAV